MLMIGHTAIGIATGLLIPDPIAAFFVGIVSHHLADWVPHFDPGSFIPPEERKKHLIHVWTKRDALIVIIDLVLTASLLWYALRHLPQRVWVNLGAGVVGANFPDLVHNVPFWNRQTRKIAWIRWWQDNIHRKYQSTIALSLWYLGLIPQVAVVVWAIWLIGIRGRGI